MNYLMSTTTTPESCKRGTAHFSIKEDEQHFQLAFDCLQSKRFSEAFFLFYELRLSENPAVMFNLALCYIECGEYRNAIDCVEIAIVKLKKLRLNTPKRHSFAATTKSNLRKAQIAQQCYLCPMNAVYPKLFIARTKEELYMLVVYAYIQLEQRVSAKKFADCLLGEEFGDFKAGLLL